MTQWGDYGRVLQHGMAHTLPRHDGLMVLLRTGPFIPPITFPGWPTFDSRGSGIVVIDSMRSALESSGLSGLSFQPVLKGRVVNLPWHEWDLRADRPQLRPLEEPEDYILRNDNNAGIAEALGDLWEIVPKQVDWVERQTEEQGQERVVDFRFVPDRWDGTDCFCLKPTALLMCSERAKTWFESNCSEWVSIAPLEATRRRIEQPSPGVAKFLELLRTHKKSDQ